MLKKPQRGVRSKARSRRKSEQDKRAEIKNEDVHSGDGTPAKSLSQEQRLIIGAGMDLVSKILLGADGALQDEESDDFFTIRPTTDDKPNDRSVKNCVDALFDDNDDPYANYCSRKGITPMSAYSAISASVAETPQCLLASPGSPDYVPTEVRIARREAMIQGQNEAKEILRRSGFDLDNYIYNMLSAKKTRPVSKNHKFRCSTPKNDSGNTASTPVNGFRIRTPLPLSGIRKLMRTPHPDDTQLCVSPITPACETADTAAAATPFNWSAVSPHRTLSTDVKHTLLSDFVCYVDVRTDKANMTETISHELLSLGAKVEKNFTKKVTVVVFKEGRVSTYLKAKKSNIPLVSVLWIEDCKRTGTVIDPSKHRPKKMDRYDDILPFETIKKRRIPKLRTVEKIRTEKLLDDGYFKSSKHKLSRKALTEIKKPCSLSGNTENICTQRHCNKKLEFISEPLNTVDTLGDAVAGSKVLPTEPVCLSQKRKRRSSKERRSGVSNLVCGLVTSGKRRKLFNPEISYLSQPLITAPESEEIPLSASTGSTVYPFSAEGSKTERRGVRTRVTAGRMKNKKIPTRPVKSAKTLLARLSEHEEIDTFRSCSRRSSFSFLDMKKREINVNEKCTPTIVFTRIPLSELKQVESAVKELGQFDIESTVSSRTTHLVASEPKRTLNIVKGIARGCWILHFDWIFKSKAAGKWLNEEQYEMVSFSPAVVQCRLERQAFGRDFCLDHFSKCGGIYICQNTRPPWKELESLVRLCSGRVVTQARAASIIVSGQPDSKTRRKSVCGLGSNDNCGSAAVVSEKWILDCITQNSSLDTAGYTIVDPLT